MEDNTTDKNLPPQDISEAPSRKWRPSDSVPVKLSEPQEKILPPPALPPAIPMRWGRTFFGEDYWGSSNHSHSKK